jgi:hypothetical protein
MRGKLAIDQRPAVSSASEPAQFFHPLLGTDSEIRNVRSSPKANGRATNHHSRLTEHSPLPTRHSPRLHSNRYQKLLETEITPSVPTPNAFLIATICPTFFVRAAFCAILIAGQKILKTDLTASLPIPNVFLIAGVSPTFTSAPPLAHHSSRITWHSRLFTRHSISNRYSRRLEIALTPSQQSRNDSLIATICPVFWHRKRFIHAPAKHQRYAAAPFTTPGAPASSHRSSRWSLAK